MNSHSTVIPWSELSSCSLRETYVTQHDKRQPKTQIEDPSCDQGQSASEICPIGYPSLTCCDDAVWIVIEWVVNPVSIVYKCATNEYLSISIFTKPQ